VTVTAEEAARRGVDMAPGAYVRLLVRDTGTGMDQGTLARLFEPFFTTKGPGKGTGLGLATVYGIVKQSRGYVWVTSAPGSGATFEIDLPAAGPAPAAAPAAVASHGAEVGGGAAPGGRETLLLVEDNVAVRAVARRILVRDGYTVLEAAHGVAALEVLERHAGPVDLVLTDVVMPQMSGRAFAEELERRRPGMRVLFMSGYTDDEILRRGVLTPGVGFLEKPFTAERLLEAVRESVRVRAADRP
jgi:CheY-like chemotaxis protein